MIARHLRWSLDAAAWVRDAVGEPLDAWQEGLLREMPQRAALCCHRQSGKSRTVAQAAAHRALYQPNTVTAVVSPSGRQSELLVKRAAEVLEKSGVKVAPTEFPDVGFHVPRGGDVLAIAAGSTGERARGYSVHFLIFDEAAQIAEDVYKATRPFIAATGGAEWMMSTPYGARGFFWETVEGTTKRGAPGYRVVRVRGDECPRFRPEFLDEERRKLGEWWFRQEYLCEFVASQGTIFRPDVVRANFADEVEVLEL